MALRQAVGRAQGVIASEGDYHEIMQDRARLNVGRLVAAEGRSWLQRTPLTGRAHEAFAAVGMRPPDRLLAGPAPAQPAEVTHAEEMG